MRRGPYAKVAARNAHLLERIRALKADHPFWGYRRIGAYLRYVDGLIVNQKRVYNVMKAADLLVRPNPKLRARRKADTRKPRPSRPNEWWGIDMTKVMIEGFGWIYLVVVLDWHTKKVVGHYAGLQARAWHWLVALNRAVNRQFPGGIEGQSLNLMADNGCQPTSLAFMRACAALSIRQVFTSYSNPKGNADTERFILLPVWQGLELSEKGVAVWQRRTAMKRRQWKPEQKALIVLEGLRGRPIGELCAEHEISQAQYYQWRDLFLANAARAFEPAGAPSRQGRLERENARLKALVGELALELKKSEEVLG
jgi:putative transposase